MPPGPALALALAAQLAAPPAGCREPILEPPAEALGAAELGAALERIRSALGAPAPECVPALELALGEVLLEQGRASEALAPLVRSSLSPALERVSVFRVLARAQALAGDPYAALASLGLSQRLSAPGSPLRPRLLEDASLLARLYLRTGGSAWGAYRYDGTWSRALPRELKDPRQVLVAGERLLVLGGRGQAGDVGPGTPVSLAADAPPALAMAPGRTGTHALLRADGSVRFSDGRVVPLQGETGRPVAGTALALGRLDEIYVIEKGQVVAYDREGRRAGRYAEPRRALDLATDDRGVLHVLAAGDDGVLLYGPDGSVLTRIPAQGPHWSWSKATALAADRFGGTYVLSRSSGLVWLFDPQGRFVGRLDPPAEDPKLLREVRALAVDEAGRVYLVASKEGPIVRYR